MAVLQTPAIILRHSTDREHDRILTVLTPQLGQVRLRARGTKKSVSKLGGSLEPMMEVNLTVAEGRTVGVIAGSVIRHRFAALRSEPVGITMGQWYLELVEAVTKPGQAATELYERVRGDLVGLQDELSWSVGKRWLSLCRRALAVMELEGFAPSLTSCALCHQALTADDVAYEPQHGYVHLREAPPGSLHLHPSAVAFLRHGAFPADERQAFANIHGLLERIIHHALDRPLKSEGVLRSIVRLSKLPTPAPVE